MRRGAGRKRGAIVNIASASGYAPTPLLTVYSATKAYMDFFSRALAAEYPYLHIQSVLPLYVASKMSKIRRAGWTAPTPTAFVRDAIRTIGHEPRTFGYWSHALQMWAASMLPRRLIDWGIYKMHNQMRLRVQARKKKTDAT